MSTRKGRHSEECLPESLFLFLSAARIPVVAVSSICQLEGNDAVAAVVLEGEGGAVFQGDGHVSVLQAGGLRIL